jgi:hypothetical protein
MHQRRAVVTRRVSATGNWEVSIPSDLAVIDNTHSWQAHDDRRIVYVSSLAVLRKDGGPTPAREIAASADRKLPASSEREEMMRDDSASLILGAAVIQAATTLGWELRGYMAADGTVALCVIDYDSPELREWAVETWRSLDVNQ